MTDADHLIDQARRARRDGDRATALDLYRAAAAGAGGATQRAHCLRHIGDLAHELGRDDEARAALDEAEVLYRGAVDDPLSLANTIRLRALLDDDRMAWREAGALYDAAALRTGLDLAVAVEECARRGQ